MIYVQMRAEDIVDVFEPQAVCRKPVEPGLLRVVERRAAQRFVFADAGIDQDIVLRGADDECLVGDHQQVLRRVVNFRRHCLQVGEGGFMVRGRKHDRRRPPWAVPFDKTRYQNVADGEWPHVFSPAPRLTRRTRR